MGQSERERLLVVAYTERAGVSRLITAREQYARSDDFMKKTVEYDDEDTLRDEYDFSQLQVVARGAGRKQKQPLIVELEPDVAQAFPTAAAVNEALRLVLRLVKTKPS